LETKEKYGTETTKGKMKIAEEATLGNKNAIT
jgi:hypothetical protein